MTIGEKIADLRKSSNLTQEQLAQKLNITPQSVSKWENNVTCPDVSLLLPLANIFDVTVDEMLGKSIPEEFIPAEKLTKKQLSKLELIVKVLSQDGDKVNIRLPYNVIKTAINTGMKIPSISEKLNGVDFQQVFDCVECGMIGKIVEVESKEGDIVEIAVE